jgi:hypothetical protein
MVKVQADFATREAAEHACEALLAAGIPPDRVRIWNVIPDSGPWQRPFPSREEAAGAALGGTAGFLTGGLAGADDAEDAFGLSGAAGGLVAGAIGGGWIGGGFSEGPRIPEPAGARLVAEVGPSDPDVEAVLQASGARAIRATAG